jgi:large subunit ribosomal protein L25
VACLPKDIPETIVADVSHLEIGDYVRAGDLSLPSGVKLVSDANVVIAHCVQPKAEEEPKPAEAAVEGAAPAAEAGAKPEAAPAKEGKEAKEGREGRDKKEGKD